MINAQRFRAYLIFALAIAGAPVFTAVAEPTGAAATSKKDAPFARYSVAEVYRGPIHLPHFRGRDRAFSLFQTRIRDGMRAGTNFAGHYAIIGWGCGTDCVDYVIGDVATGKVFNFPLGGENNNELRLDIKPASRLIVARWINYTDKSSANDEWIVDCFRQNLIWNGISAVPLSKPILVASVKYADVDSCDNK